jgi:hypothetical protein
MVLTQKMNYVANKGTFNQQKYNSPMLKAG